jgi:hypothetical protein
MAATPGGAGAAFDQEPLYDFPHGPETRVVLCVASGSPVVVKQFHGRLADPKPLVQALRREQEAVGARRPPGTAALARFGRSPAHWREYPLVPGGDLLGYVASVGGPLPEWHSLVLARDLARTLAGLADANICHGLVGARHVLLRWDGRPVLAGFANMRLAGRPQMWLNGDDNFLPPEYFARARTLTQQRDVYGLGMLLYLVRTGALPYERRAAREPWAAIERIFDQPPADPPFPPADPLFPLWRRMVARELAERPTAREAAAEIDAVARRRLAPAAYARFAAADPGNGNSGSGEGQFVDDVFGALALAAAAFVAPREVLGALIGAGEVRGVVRTAESVRAWLDALALPQLPPRELDELARRIVGPAGRARPDIVARYLGDPDAGAWAEPALEDAAAAGSQQPGHDASVRGSVATS